MTLAPRKTLRELDLLAETLGLTEFERKIADVYAVEVAKANGGDPGSTGGRRGPNGAITNTSAAIGSPITSVWRALQRQKVKQYLAEITVKAREIVQKRTGEAVMETAEILERLSAMARGARPTKTIRDRQRRPKAIEVPSEGVAVVMPPETERLEYDTLRAAVELGNIHGLYKQDAPPPPPSNVHETWFVFLKTLPPEVQRAMHRQMFRLGLGEGTNGGNGTG